MTNLKARILALLVIGGLATYFLILHQAHAALRSENLSLRQQSDQMARLCAGFRAIATEQVGPAPGPLTETVTIDCASDAGPLTHCGSGFLYGFSANGVEPGDGAVAPLNLRLHRTRIEDTLAQAGRLKALGAQQQVVLSDAWGYGAAYPGDHGDWARWEKFVRRQIELTRQAGLSVQFDIWNEPDHGSFWGRTPEQFLETWTRAHRLLRAADPAVVIVGPSWSNVHPGQPRFEEFLLRCRASGTLPDYITWHFPLDTVGEVRHCREFCAREAIAIKGIMINEYCGANEQNAATTAWHLAQLEQARVEGACHAIWADERTHNNLDGLLVGGAPRGQWWVYRRYAEMAGRLLASTSSAKVATTAAADGATGRLNLLLGRRGGAGLRVLVCLDHLEALPFLAGRDTLQAQIEQIPENQGNAVTNLPVLFSGTSGTLRGHAEFLIPWLNPGDAYALHISTNEPPH